MANVFNYQDYREYLADFYKEKKDRKGYISYRMMGQHINVDASYLVKVFKQVVHLQPSSIPSILQFCGLEDKEARFFEALFYFTRAKNEKDISRYYEKMQAILGAQDLTLKTGQYEFN